MEPTPTETARSSGGLKIWHLALLVAFVAFAIVEIQNHRRPQPFLVGLAAGGFAGYALLAWLGWRFVRPFQEKRGAVLILGLYLTSMAALFLLATVIYLVIEHNYLMARF